MPAKFFLRPETPHLEPTAILPLFTFISCVKNVKLMPLLPHEELYRMQRKLYLRNKEIIDHSVLIKEPDFDRYQKRYQRKVANYKRIVSHEEMLNAIQEADIIYVGDYHTCNQSQRSFLRILKAVIKKTKNIMIGLELIHKNNQKVLDSYMRGEIEDGDFLKKIGFHQHWIFDLWGNFRPIIDFAKYHHVNMFALDAAGIDSPLKERDETTAELIAKYITKNPGKKLFVLIGDLHLAPQHLPEEVAKILKNVSPPLKAITLYQNSESIYWKLAKKGIEDQVEVVKIDDSSFCRMHTPPVVCQQSYINWLEHEEGEIDYADAKHSFLELVDRISDFLNIKLGKEKDDVEVYTSGDLGFLKRLSRKKNFTKRELKAVKLQILSSESYYIAKQKIVYLANLSVNHASEEASHFIKHLCSGTEFPRDFVDAFYANILHEALGFFGSKLINSKRKCLHEIGFRDILAYFDTVRVPNDRRLEYETAHLVTEYFKYEKKGKSLQYAATFNLDATLFMSVTHALGYMLGDKMYYAMKSGKLKCPKIKEMFFDKWQGEGRPFEAYSAATRSVKGVKIPKRM